MITVSYSGIEHRFYDVNLAIADFLFVEGSKINKTVSISDIHYETP